MSVINNLNKNLDTLQILINDHFIKLLELQTKINNYNSNPIPNSQQQNINSEENEKSEFKNFNFQKYLIANKFKTGDNKRDMITDQFYNNLTSNPTNTDFYLTNGANKSLNKFGGGTTGAIAQINEEFFNLNNMKCIFNSNNLIKNNYSDQDLNLTISSCNNVGSTYYIEIKDNKYKNYNVIGVYHINGWRNPSNNENTDIYKTLVSSYYIVILDHFFNNIQKKNRLSILHLVQCPGAIYQATEITAEIFKNTVGGYLFIKRNEINNLNFKISIDYDFDNTKINFKDIEYLHDIIKNMNIKKK
jgi:hypothetical protein